LNHEEIISCNHCPSAQSYEDRIISFSKEYKPKGVDVVMISPNNVDALNYSELGYSDMGDSFEDMKQHAADKGFPFPYLYDGDDQLAALAYGPVATPRCFVFDRGRILRYKGRLESFEKPGIGKGEDLRYNVDTECRGALPFTLLVEPGGKIVYKKQDMIDPHQMKKLIVENKYIGRYY